LSQGGLLDRQKRTHLITARADHTDCGCYQEQNEIASQGEEHTGEDHQRRSDYQHALAPKPISIRRKP